MQHYCEVKPLLVAQSFCSSLRVGFVIVSNRPDQFTWLMITVQSRDEEDSMVSSLYINS